MILSDKTLKRLIVEEKLIDTPQVYVGPSSIDLTLANDFSWPWPLDGTLDFRRYDQGDTIAPCEHSGAKVQDYFLLQPRGFVLGSTQEVVHLPENISAMIQGRSSVARLGLQVHAAAGYIDAGFKGRITLELSNLTDYAMKLPVGLPICQLICFQQDEASAEPYIGRYQFQYKATPTRLNVLPPEEGKVYPDDE